MQILKYKLFSFDCYFEIYYYFFAIIPALGLVLCLALNLTFYLRKYGPIFIKNRTITAAAVLIIK